MDNREKIVFLFVALALFLSASVVVFAGGAKEEYTGEQDTLKVILYLNGTLGDKSFFDSAARGVEMAVDEFGIRGKVVEGGYNSARWEPDLAQLCEGDWDIIIAGTWQLQEFLEKYAPQYPEKRFFTYDNAVNYDLGGLDNVYSILYSQNEGSFLMGALSAMVTKSGMPAANDDLIIGFLGGMDIPVINDFKVGFEEGAAYIDPQVKVLVSYAGAFDDPAMGKELTLAMYDQGADISFNVAGETGLGGIDAAKERGRYTLGVDSDQYLLFADTDAEKASAIVTSMMKNVDLSIYRAIEKHLNGTLAYGEAEVLGLATDGIGVAENENYNKLISASVRNQLEELKEMIINGEIAVGTALGQ